MRSIGKLWPILLLAAVAVAAYATGLQHYLSFAALAQQEQWLRGLVSAHPILAPLAYIGAYTLAVAVSLPGGIILSVAGGVLFGTVLGSVCAVIGATAGAIVLFLAARSALGDLLAKRAGALIDRVRPGLERDGFSYLLAIRLLPVVPFWLLNLAPALAGMRLAPYALATFLGIIPGTVVFVSIGAGLSFALAAGERPGLGVVLRPAILLPLLGLAILALTPVLWRQWRARHAGP